MMWIGSLLALGILSLFAVGRSLETGTWEGTVSIGRTGTTFRPCNTRVTWWVKNKDLTQSADDLEKQYHEIAEKPYQSIYIRLKGDASRKGQYGPLGSYQRVLYVDEVLEIRLPEEDDCKKEEENKE